MQVHQFLIWDVSKASQFPDCSTWGSSGVWNGTQGLMLAVGNVVEFVTCPMATPPVSMGFLLDRTPHPASSLCACWWSGCCPLTFVHGHVTHTGACLSHTFFFFFLSYSHRVWHLSLFPHFCKPSELQRSAREKVAHQVSSAEHELLIYASCIIFWDRKPLYVYNLLCSYVWQHVLLGFV